MNLKCLLGYHDWGKQTNIREKKFDTDAALLMPVIFLAILDLFPSRVCERRCLRCNKVKTFDYDAQRG